MQLYKQWFRRLVSGLSETSPQILNSLLQSWALQTIPAKHKNPFLNRLRPGWEMGPALECSK